MLNRIYLVSDRYPPYSFTDYVNR